MIKSAQSLAGLFVCVNSTGAITTPSIGPTCTLYVNGVSNAAVVSVTGSNPYKYSVTLPTLTAGNLVQVYMTATIDGVSTAEVLFQDVGDTSRVSDISPTIAVSAAQAAAAASGTLAIRSYHTWSQAITSTSTAALDTATKLWLAVKSSPSDADTASIVFIEKTGGLTVLNGATYSTVANGTLAATGESGAWTITATMEEAATALLSEAYLHAELKALVSGSTVNVWSGYCTISTGIVRAYA